MILLIISLKALEEIQHLFMVKPSEKQLMKNPQKRYS